MENKEIIKLEINGEIYEVVPSDLVPNKDGIVQIKSDSEKSKSKYGRVSKTFKRASELMNSWYTKVMEYKNKRESDKFTRLSEDKMNENIENLETAIEEKRKEKLDKLANTIADYKKQIESYNYFINLTAQSAKTDYEKRIKEIRVELGKEVSGRIAEQRQLQHEIEALEENPSVINNRRIKELKDQMSTLDKAPLRAQQLEKEILELEALLADPEKLNASIPDGTAKQQYAQERDDLQQQVMIAEQEMDRIKNMSVDELANELNQNSEMRNILTKKKRIKEALYPTEEEMNRDVIKQVEEVTESVKEEVQQFIEEEKNSTLSPVEDEEEIVPQPVVMSTIEEPVMEKVEEVIEQPVVEEPVVEKAEEIIEQPVVEEPVVEKAEEVIEQPVVEEPVVEKVEEVIEQSVVEAVEPVSEEKETTTSKISGFFETEQGKMMFEQTKASIRNTTDNMINVFENVMTVSNSYYKQLATRQDELENTIVQLEGQIKTEKETNSKLQIQLDQQHDNYEDNYTPNTVVESIKAKLNAEVNQKEAMLQEEIKQHNESNLRIDELTKENENLRQQLKDKDVEIETNYVAVGQYNYLKSQYKELAEKIQPLLNLYNQMEVSTMDVGTIEEEKQHQM